MFDGIFHVVRDHERVRLSVTISSVILSTFSGFRRRRDISSSKLLSRMRLPTEVAPAAVPSEPTSGSSGPQGRACHLTLAVEYPLAGEIPAGRAACRGDKPMLSFPLFHVGRGPHHRVLEDPAEVSARLCSAPGNIYAVKNYFALVNREHAGYRVYQRRFRRRCPLL